MIKITRTKLSSTSCRVVNTLAKHPANKRNHVNTELTPVDYYWTTVEIYENLAWTSIKKLLTF